MLSLHTVTRGSYQLLTSPEWESQGLIHGFVGASGNFATDSLPEEWRRFRPELALTDLGVLSQVHGNRVFRVTEDNFQRSVEQPQVLAEADAMLVGPGRYGGLCLGIRTADCLCILARCGKWHVLVHAGWRGLAAGVCEQALSALASEGGSVVEALIGPCAGLKLYEVGPEVIEQLGKDAVYERAGGDRYRLSLAETMIQRIKRSVFNVEFCRADVCTISSSSWHSYRRDGNGSGRNFAFVVLP